MVPGLEARVVELETRLAFQEQAVADLLTDAARSAGPLPVVDDRQRLVGVVARVTLLNALGGSWTNGSDPVAEGGDAVGEAAGGSEWSR